MSSRIYALLLRLYPSAFRQAYGEEALRLFHDRLRDETGFLARLRLWWELVFDLIVSVPRQHHRARPVVIRRTAVAASHPGLQFGLLEEGEFPSRRALVGATIIAIAAVGLVTVGAMLSGRTSAREQITAAVATPETHVDRAAAQSIPPPVAPTTLKASPALEAHVKSMAAQSVPPRASSLEPPAAPKLVNATDAMLNAFQTHDIVMFGEVHGSKQEYEWLCSLVKTPQFSDQVNAIVVEFGNARYQSLVDRYVAGDNVSFDQVQSAWRNMVANVGPVSPVYGWFYRAVREANLKNPHHRIRLIMGSPPADWSRIKTTAELAPFESEREQWYVLQVKSKVLANHQRALLIMGASHFLRGRDQALDDELAIQQHRSVPPLNRELLKPGYIERQLRDSGANPYVVVLGSDAIDDLGDTDPRFTSWPTPVIASLSGNWVGSLPAQPVLTDGHAHATPLTLLDQADAMLYVAPCTALQVIYPPRSEIQETAYGEELARRDKLLVGRTLTFSYGLLPQCTQPAHVTK